MAESTELAVELPTLLSEDAEATAVAVDAGGGDHRELDSIEREEDEAKLQAAGAAVELAAESGSAVEEETEGTATTSVGSFYSALYSTGTSVFYSLKYNRLRQISEYLRGNTTQPAAQPLWLLGVLYDLTADSQDESLNKDELELFKADWFSRIWVTYRKGFEKVEDDQQIAFHDTDVGWGCMFRSGQMMLAQGLLQYHLGRDWRYQGPQSSEWVAR